MQLNGVEPIFLQVASYYRRLIQIGALKDGEMLPSVREVAVENRINPNTVQRAYSLLAEEGYLSSIPKKGNFVKYQKEKKMDQANLRKALEALLQEGYSKQDIQQALEALEAKHD